MTKPKSIYHPQIEMVLISDLVPNSKNARRHSRKQIGKIAKSIVAFKWTMPALIDENNMVLLGHGRIDAGRELGMASIPCIRRTDLSEADKIALALADNKLSDESSFDDDMVKSLLTELAGINFDIDATGFDPGEIDFRIDGPAGSKGNDPADVLPPPSLLPPVSQAGDV